MSLNLATLSNEDIARRCNSPDGVLISGLKGGRRVVKLSNDIAVKVGWGVTPEEAANQEYAHAYLGNGDIKVPKVYRYFRLSGVAYLVMEYVQGESLEKIPLRSHPDIVRRLVLAICTLVTVAIPEFPGPANGGLPQGYLFSEDATTNFNSITDLNIWLNERVLLGKGEQGFNFGMSDCTFCHLDITRRNILLLPDNRFCLLDWGYAGFYPRAFEVYCLRCTAFADLELHHSFLGPFQESFPWMEDDAEQQRLLKMLNRVYGNNLRYSFGKIRPDRDMLLQLWKADQPQELTRL